MNDKVNHWIDIAERVINIIRPKAYNTIAKVTILTGLGLIGESQIKFIHAIIVAFFEEYIGKSEILRTFLDVSGSPTTGFFLVVIGMIYHIIVTLGNEYINTKKSELPKHPMLNFYFKNKNNDSLDNGEIYLDELRYNFEQVKNIPDYVEPVENREEKLLTNKTELSNTIELLEKKYRSQCLQKRIVNTNFYKERLNILQEWLGYEKLSLSIVNDSEVFASGIRVRLCIPKNEGVTVKTIGEEIPKRPETHTNFYPTGMPLSNHFYERILDEVKPFITEYDDFYEISFEREKLQANTIAHNRLDLLVKINESIDINYTIFCDQLPRPFNSKITLHPSDNIKAIKLDDIIKDDNFERLYISIHEVFKED